MAFDGQQKMDHTFYDEDVGMHLHVGCTLPLA